MPDVLLRRRRAQVSSGALSGRGPTITRRLRAAVSARGSSTTSRCTNGRRGLPCGGAPAANGAGSTHYNVIAASGGLGGVVSGHGGRVSRTCTLRPSMFGAVPSLACGTLPSTPCGCPTLLLTNRATEGLPKTAFRLTRQLRLRERF